MSANLRSWISALGSLVAAIVLLWWAQQQWLALRQIAGSTFQMPTMRLLLWMLTLIVTGFSFGMAASSARNERKPGRPAMLLTLSFVPFAVLYYVWTQLALGWFPQLPGGLSQFLYNESVLLTASIVLGFFLSGLAGGVGSASETVDEPADKPSDDEADDDSTSRRKVPDREFAAQARALESAYLQSADPMMQSGFSGGRRRWVSERSPLVEAIHRDGDFLDLGGAGGPADHWLLRKPLTRHRPLRRGQCLGEMWSSGTRIQSRRRADGHAFRLVRALTSTCRQSGGPRLWW